MTGVTTIIGPDASPHVAADQPRAVEPAADVVIARAEPYDNDWVRTEVAAYLKAAPGEQADTTSRGAACNEHDPRWLDVLHDGLRHEVYMLVARRGDATDDEVCGYLPVALVASQLFGRFLVSLPYLNRAGVVADDARAADALIAKAVELAADKDAQYLELRHGQPIAHESLGQTKSDKVRMVLDLPTGDEALWKSLDAKVRNQVRKGDKSELSIRWGGRELLDGFYNVFAVNMRDLGTPVFGRKLFTRILDQFAGQAELAVVECKGQAIAGALLIHEPARTDRDGRAVPGSTAVPSASSLRQYNSTNCNMWMYHHLLRRAIERGSKEFDFGRSSEDSGTYKFKKQWGAQPRATVWQYHVRRGEIGAARPDNPKYARRIAIWQKLPVWLTRVVGPSIVRGIP